MIRGIDASMDCSPYASNLQALGVGFVARYYSNLAQTRNPAKVLTPREAHDLSQAGFSLVVVWEFLATPGYFTSTQRQADGEYAYRYAVEVIRQPENSAIPIAGMKGTLRAASWNDVGLAAIVDNSLYVWEAGSKNIVRMLTDQGLSAAKDVVLVGHNRAVVSLRATVVLVTNEAMTVVTGMTRARCGFQRGVLYLLDGETGIVWTLSGLDQLGNKKGDQSYAADLLKQVPGDSAESSVQFREAARIIGCASAKQQLVSARDLHAPSTSAKH